MTKGFSLIELMVVVVIVGILVAVAYPSYINHITKSRRSDGQTALLDLANRMERYFSENHTYATATIAAGNAATDVLGSNLSPEQWYTISIPAKSAFAYTIQATPRNAQATEDTLCQSLTLNNLGQKGITAGPAGNPTGTADNCW